MSSMREVELDGLGHGGPQTIGATGEGIRMRSRKAGVSEYEGIPSVEQQAYHGSERKWCVFTAIASCLDIVASTIILVVAFKYAYRDNGVSLYCMGMQALSHELSSMLLLARLVGELLLYNSPEGSDTGLLKEQRRKSLLREQAACIAMGIVMLISSVSLLFKAFRKLRFWDKWYVDHQNMDAEAAVAMDWLAWWGFGIYTVQAIFRFFAGRNMRQSLVWHCFVASVVSLLYLLILGIGALEEKEWNWKAEPIAAIALSLVTLAEGVRIIYYYFDDMETRMIDDPRA